MATFFEIPEVVRALRATGWSTVWTADMDDLSTPVAFPEALSRVFFVATSTETG